jgi:transcriptional repressor NrdR
MKCPFCNHAKSKVVDSRLSRDKEAIRRRRECLSCQKRFTTSERPEDDLPLVVKKDGRREPFNRSRSSMASEELQKAHRVALSKIISPSNSTSKRKGRRRSRVLRSAKR